MPLQLSTHSFVAVLLAMALLQSTLAAPARTNNQLKMKLINHAGYPIVLWWINTFVPGRPLVLQSEAPVRNSTVTYIDTYITHEFLVTFMDDKNGFEGAVGHFVKRADDETMDVYFDSNIGNFTVKQSTIADVWAEKVAASMARCGGVDPDLLAKCVGADVAVEVTKLQESQQFMRTQRDAVAKEYRNYTCADETLNTTTPIATSTFVHQETQYTVDTLFDHSHAKIWLAHDMITDEECSILAKHAEGKLTRASVVNANGTASLSDHRKAQQAQWGMPLDWPSIESNALWPLFHRILKFASEYGKLSLQPVGQEGFVIIQYNPNADDQYFPHCDGACHGEEYKAGGRVATAVFYCTPPIRGGATTFSKANVFVRPKKNAASVFVYKGEDGLMDDSYTEHSGCPVLEGEKWITTAWMREGVSAERTFEHVDPHGVPILKVAQQEPVAEKVASEILEGEL